MILHWWDILVFTSSLRMYEDILLDPIYVEMFSTSPRTCPHCQIAKPRNNLPYGLIMPLQPPEEPWQDISMDLIVHLPNSQIFNAIFVVVDRFSKMAHFIPTQIQISAPELAQIFLDSVVRLHGFPRSIVSDRDPRFLSHF